MKYIKLILLVNILLFEKSLISMQLQTDGTWLEPEYAAARYGFSRNRNDNNSFNNFYLQLFENHDNRSDNANVSCLKHYWLGLYLYKKNLSSYLLDKSISEKNLIKFQLAKRIIQDSASKVFVFNYGVPMLAKLLNYDLSITVQDLNPGATFYKDSILFLASLECFYMMLLTSLA